MTALSATIASSGYGSVNVLQDLSIRVEGREIVAVLGANGVGKTTLLRTLSGVGVRTDASIELDGERIDGLKPHRRVAAGLAHVPEGRRVFRELTVRENLEVAASARKASQPDREADLSRVLDVFPDLSSRSSQLAGSLSGGQQQMLAIGRALMCSPRLLMVDEASLGLAPATVASLFGSLRQLRDDGLTVLLVEQNARASLALADRAYVLARGTVAVEGSAESLRQDGRVMETYLGVPMSSTSDQRRRQQ